MVVRLYRRPTKGRDGPWEGPPLGWGRLSRRARGLNVAPAEAFVLGGELAFHAFALGERLHV